MWIVGLYGSPDWFVSLVKTNGEVVKGNTAVIDFVGKAPWFDEWFKSWEEYEAYVKSHNNIFKIFSLSGHYEIYPGCEIQKLRAFESCVPITDKKYQYIINGLQQWNT